MIQPNLFLLLIYMVSFLVHIPMNAQQENSNLQQQFTISGLVTDINNESLPGVTVTVYGNTRGVATALDGTFWIRVLPTDQLVFSFIGMTDQIIPVQNRREFVVIMKEKTNELDEVTIVAFGKQKKRV